MKKQILFTVLVAGLFASCSSPSKIVATWRDPNTTITNPQLHKIVVAAIIYDPSVRRQVEDYMASLYPGQATPSYALWGQQPITNNEEAYTRQLKSQGYDGIVIIRQTSEHTTSYYVPGTMPTYFHTWGGYWNHGWGATWVSPGRPGYVGADRHWAVEVTVYSILENKLIWSANTMTTNPGGRVPLFTDVCDAARKQMKKEKFML